VSFFNFLSPTNLDLLGSNLEFRSQTDARTTSTQYI
jgi:hypothetical protein